MTRGRLPDSLADGLRETFGARLQEGAELASHTSARLGGTADFLIVARSSAELSQTAQELWAAQAPFRVLGAGSNVLISDAGVREVVVLNQASEVRFSEPAGEPQIWAESGVSFGSLARRAAERGWSGLEWAATVPGTVGGAVVGNAGAHGSDMRDNLETAEILQPGGQAEGWSVDRLEYGYRDSWLKRNPGQAVVLSATLRLERSDTETTKAKVAEYAAQRQRTQPPGASLGSMFKNPPGDHAGRLIEAAGLKGFRSGQAEISAKHANFFINLGGATAGDVWTLIQTARRRVAEQFGVTLEMEVQLLGDWSAEQVGSMAGGGGAA